MHFAESASAEVKVPQAERTDPITSSRLSSSSTGSRDPGSEFRASASSDFRQKPMAPCVQPPATNAKNEQPPLAARVFRIGKFAGKTFAEVAASDSGYCRWALGIREPVGQLAEFVQYLRVSSVDGNNKAAIATSPFPDELDVSSAPLQFRSSASKGAPTVSLQSLSPLEFASGASRLVDCEEEEDAAAAVDAWIGGSCSEAVLDFEVPGPQRPTLKIDGRTESCSFENASNPSFGLASAQRPAPCKGDAGDAVLQRFGRKAQIGSLFLDEEDRRCQSSAHVKEGSAVEEDDFEFLNGFAFNPSRGTSGVALSPATAPASSSSLEKQSDAVSPETVEASLSVEVCGKTLFRVVSLQQQTQQRRLGGGTSLLSRGAFAGSGSVSRSKCNIWSPQLPRVVAEFLLRFAFASWDPLPPFVLLAFPAFRRFAPRVDIPKKTWLSLNPERVTVKPATAPGSREAEQVSLTSRKESCREVFLEPTLYGSLRDFQKEGVVFGLERQGRVLIGDEMGLGKTLQALTIAAQFVDDWPLLVVCPSSIRFQWRDQALRWLSHLVCEDEICIVRNGKTDVPPHTRIIIISYDLLAMQEKFQARYQCVICDESHYLKNQNAKRTQVICPILKRARRAILLSGTPALNRPVELYQQVNALLPEFCSYRAFSSRYSLPILNAFSRRLEDEGHQHEEELHLLLTNTIMIRRLKSQVLTQLPNKIRSRVPVEVSAKDLREIRSKMDGMDSADLLQDMQSSGGFSSHSGGSSSRSLASELFALTGRAKLPSVCDYLSYLLQLQEQEGSQGKGGARCCKCLVFAHHTAVLDGLETFMQKKEKRKYVRIDGKCSLKEREERVKHFQTSPECQVALLSITACGQGLDLTAAGLVVFAELFWVPGCIVQAEDRSHRIGNEHKSVQIHYLIAEGTIDDAVYRQLQQKWSVMTAALDGKQQQLTMQSHAKASTAASQPKLKVSLLNSAHSEARVESVALEEVSADSDDAEVVADLAQALSPKGQQGKNRAPQQPLIHQFFKKSRVA